MIKLNCTNFSLSEKFRFVCCRNINFFVGLISFSDIKFKFPFIHLQILKYLHRTKINKTGTDNERVRLGKCFKWTSNITWLTPLIKINFNGTYGQYKEGQSINLNCAWLDFGNPKWEWRMINDLKMYKNVTLFK